MHIIATNLSVWLTTIATEATEALVYEKKLKDWQSQQDDDALVNESNPKAYDLEGSAEIEDGEVFGVTCYIVHRFNFETIVLVK